MRTTILSAAILGLFAAGCAGELSGTGDDTGDDAPATCGNGAVDTDEACDDGNTTNGDGCSASCQFEASAGRVSTTLDKPTVATELKSTNMVTATLTSMDGFTGSATVAAKVVDGGGVAITGWSVTLDKSSVTLTEGGSDSVVATLTIPSDSRTLTGNLVIDVTTSAGTESVTSAITAAQQITLDVTVVNNDCTYPADVTIVSGTKVRFYNPNTVDFVIHSNGGGSGIPHQGSAANQSPDDPVTEAGTAYERVSSGGAAAFRWYCHDLGPDNGNNNPLITIVAQ